jgi:hypothetical protein
MWILLMVLWIPVLEYRYPDKKKLVSRPSIRGYQDTGIQATLGNTAIIAFY